MSAALIVCLGVGACSPTIRHHGYIPIQEDLAQIEVGRDSREVVRNILGRPTSEGVSTDNAYYFVQSRFRHFGPLRPREIERQVLTVRFDSQDIVANISRYGLEDGRVVMLSRRVTDDNSDDISLITQILGNVGNFDAAGLIGDGS